MKLDKIDKKILHRLCYNCRTPISRIAKELKLSKSTVMYRIKNLEKRKIIASYSALINYKNLGIMYGRFQCKLSNVSPEIFDKITQFLKGMPHVSWIGSVHGMVDIAMVIYFRTVKEFRDTIVKIKSKIGKYIESQETSLASCVYHCVPNVLLGKFIDPVAVQYFGERRRFDEIDRKLIWNLKNNARISIIELAKKIGCSTKTVIARKKKLEKEGVILRYKAIINKSLLGYESYHIFWHFYDFDHDKVEKFKNFILQMPETHYVTESLSRSNLESEFLVKNQNELFQLINRLKEVFPKLIRNYEYMLMYEEHKYF